MKFFKKISKKRFFIISPIIFLSIILISFRSISRKENLNYWLKENFTGGYVFFFNTRSTIRKNLAIFYYTYIKRNIEPSEKNEEVYTEEIDSFWHKIKKETIPASDYLTQNANRDLPGIPGGYFAFIDNTKIILTNGVGEIFTYNFDKKEFIKVDSNLNKIYESQEFKGKVIRNLFGRFGIKDLHLDKVENKLYASMTVENKKGSACYGMGIFKADLDSKNLANKIDKIEFKEYFKTKECNKHFNGHATGGRIKSLKGDILYTVGDLDHNLDGDRKIPQNKNNAIGKLIAIDKNGNFEVISSGHRNPQGLYILDKTIFLTEHGPRGGDEINLIEKGKHYGWPYYSYGFTYADEDIFRIPHENGFEKPIYYFSPAIAISEIAFYKEGQFNKWQNKFLVGGLKSKALWLLDFDMEKKRFMSQEKIDIGHRVRDFGISNNGSIVLITDDQKIIRLQIADNPKWKIKDKINFP